MPGLRDNLSTHQLEAFDHPPNDEPERIKLFMPSDLRDPEARLRATLPSVIQAEEKL